MSIKLYKTQWDKTLWQINRNSLESLAKIVFLDTWGQQRQILTYRPYLSRYGETCWQTRCQSTHPAAVEQMKRHYERTESESNCKLVTRPLITMCWNCGSGARAGHSAIRENIGSTPTPSVLYLWARHWTQQLAWQPSVCVCIVKFFSL